MCIRKIAVLPAWTEKKLSPTGITKFKAVYLPTGSFIPRLVEIKILSKSVQEDGSDCEISKLKKELQESKQREEKAWSSYEDLRQHLADKNLLPEELVKLRENSKELESYREMFGSREGLEQVIHSAYEKKITNISAASENAMQVTPSNIKPYRSLRKGVKR